MPYKNPEHKRQWEREHRQQRNAQRRMRRLEGKKGSTVAYPVPDPILAQKPKSGWKGIVGLAVGLGVVLLAVLSGVTVPDAGSRGPLPNLRG